jgi:predicted dehydrogenase
VIRIGLLGAGFIGETHAAAMQAVAGVELAAVADANREAADRVAGEFGARAYHDAAAMFGDGSIDAVDICVPTFLHCDMVIAAAERGKHILCEKPIALSVAEVDRMIAAVRAAGVKSMVAQCVRFWPQYLAAKQLLDAGVLGRPLMATASRLAGPPSWSSWFRDPKLSGGAILDLHIHDLDYLYYLFGAPEQVCAVGTASDTGAWDDVLTLLRYPGHGASARAGYRMPRDWPFSTHFRILGDQACVEYRFRVGGQIDNRSSARTEFLLFRPGEAPREPACPTRDAYEAEIEYFVGCVQDGRDPEIATLQETRTVLRMALAARQSLETGQAIDFRADGV